MKELDHREQLRLKVSAGILGCNPTVESLKESLLRKYPKIESGSQKADNLIKEILVGESNFDQVKGEIILVVHIAAVFITYNSKELHEIRQEHINGDVLEIICKGIRKKIKGVESPVEAAIRAMKEQLGMEVESHDLYPIAEDFLDNPQSDYQGLKSKTHLYSFSTTISPDNFSAEYRDVQPEKTVVFAWL